MADRGDGSERFTRGPEACGKSWRVISTQNELKIHFDPEREGLPPQILDVTTWMVCGKQARAFAEAFASHYSALARSTRANHVKQFRNCFCAFLVEKGLKIDEPNDAPKNLLIEFYRWNKHYFPTNNKTGTEAHSDLNREVSLNTQHDRVKPVKTIFSILTKKGPTSGWNVDIPKNPFAGKKPQPVQTKAVDLLRYVALLEKSAEDALATMEEVGSHFDDIQKSKAHLEAGKPYDRYDLHHVIALALLRYDGIIPERQQLKQHDRQLFRDLEYHGYSHLRRLAHPQAPDLIPFIYLMAAHTGFNQQPLTHIELAQIVEPTILGVGRIILSPEKRRAKSVVRRSFSVSEEKLSVSSIVSFLKTWTKHLRGAAPEFVKNDLWIYANKWKNSKGFAVRSLAARDRAAPSDLQNHLLRYCRQHGFNFYGMREIRLSFSELFLRLNHGDLEKLRVLLGQKSIMTTVSSYQTRRVQAEGEERLAGSMLMRERWVRSGGAVDPRVEGSKRSRSAATPGFHCIDMFDSPILGQEKGQLCNAYGRCPECPLAQLVEDEAYAIARLLQLSQAYERAKGNLGIEIFKRKYVRSAEAVESQWLPKFANEPSLFEKAGALLLPQLPPLE